MHANPPFLSDLPAPEAKEDQGLQAVYLCFGFIRIRPLPPTQCASSASGVAGTSAAGWWKAVSQCQSLLVTGRASLKAKPETGANLGTQWSC